MKRRQMQKKCSDTQNTRYSFFIQFSKKSFFSPCIEPIKRDNRHIEMALNIVVWNATLVIFINVVAVVVAVIFIVAGAVDAALLSSSSSLAFF